MHSKIFKLEMIWVLIHASDIREIQTMGICAMEQPENSGYCPVMDMLCPQGSAKAQECRTRFETEFDPVRNLRDFELFCCAMERTAEPEIRSAAI